MTSYDDDDLLDDVLVALGHWYYDDPPYNPEPDDDWHGLIPPYDLPPTDEDDPEPDEQDDDQLWLSDHRRNRVDRLSNSQ